MTAVAAGQVAGKRVGFRCDASPETGVGHVMRSAALAEEFAARGWEIDFATETAGVSLADARLVALGCGRVAAPTTADQHIAWLRSSGLDAVVIDSYALAPDVSSSMVAEVPVLAFADGEPRGQTASLFVDQNFGADLGSWPTDGRQDPFGVPVLAGSRYAVIADGIRRLRPQAPTTARDAPTVVVALGGTDAHGLTGEMVRAIAETDADFRAMVMAPTRLPGTSNWVPVVDDPRIAYMRPSPAFPEMLSRADAVVGASGSSLWEFCCLGLPIASVAVSDNQVSTHRALVSSGVIHGLGDASRGGVGRPELVERLREFLGDPLLRDRLARKSFSLIDGAGKARIVDAFTRVRLGERREGEA